MKTNNLNDKYLDKLNDDSQTLDGINSQVYRIVPFGKNGQGSFKLFHQRKNYEKALNQLLEQNLIDIKSFKDLIYFHILYGKINNNNQSIIVKKQKIKQLTCEKKISLIDVAADAYDDLYKKHKSIINRKLISTKSKFYDITPKVGYTSANLEHSQYVNFYFNEFLTFIKSKSLQNDLSDFKDLFKYFLYFYNDKSNSNLINKSNFIFTTLCTPFTTGLVVQFTEDKHDDDKNKFDKYLSDVSFLAFDNLVKEFGFVIDRHAPWRLVFDLSSPTAQKYLNKYGINNINDYFEQYYDVADVFDYDTFKINFLNLYNFIVNEKPEINKITFKSKNDKICVSQKTITRKLVDLKNIKNSINEEDILKVYFYSKCIENNLISSESQYLTEIDEILAIYKFQSIGEALKIISHKSQYNKNKGKKDFRMFLF